MFDAAFAYVKIVASSLSDKAKAVLVNVSAFGDGDGDEDPDAEGSPDEPLWGALGVVSRPRKPSADGHAEAIAARSENGLRPIAARDLRVNKARGNVNEGAVGIAGYGGAFVSIDDAPSGGGSIVTVYAPYAFDGSGVPAKALTISLDTTKGGESIVVAHASGAAVVMTTTGELVLRSDTGKASIILKGDAVTINGGTISILGNVTVGGGPTTKITLGDATPGVAVPMLPGAAFLGSAPNILVQHP